MKFRYKWIINRSIIILWILIPLGLFIGDGTLYSFLCVLSVFIVVIIFRYKNYIELDDIGVKQVKYWFFSKKITIILYKEINDIDLKTNHTLSKKNIGNHSISATLGKKIEFGKIFYFGKFKDTLEGRIKGKNINISLEISDYTKYIDKTSLDYFPLRYGKLVLFEIRFDTILCIGFIVYYIFRFRIDLDNTTVGKYIIFPIPIFALTVFVGFRIYNYIKKRPFVMLGDTSLTVAQNFGLKYNVQKIPYSNIEKIEIYKPGNIISNAFMGVCFNIILKGKENEKEISNGLKDWESFQEALERKGIDVKFI